MAYEKDITDSQALELILDDWIKLHNLQLDEQAAETKARQDLRSLETVHA